MQYRRLAADMEKVVQRKQAQVEGLEAVNRQLKQKEFALQCAIGSIEGGLHCAGSITQRHTNSCSISNGGTGSDSVSAEQQTQTGDHGSPSSCCSLPALCEPPPRAAAIIQQMEDEVQGMQRLLGQDCCYSGFYSTQLLQRVLQHAAGAEALVAMDRRARICFVRNHVAQLGLWLPKYDAAVGPSGCGVRDRVEATFDELLSVMLAWGLLDSQRHLALIMVNLETEEYEPYPDGFWDNVAGEILPMLSDEQRVTFSTCWALVRHKGEQLRTEHRRITAELASLRQQQQLAFQRFDEAAQQLSLHPPAWLGILQQQRTGRSSKQQQQHKHQQDVAGVGVQRPEGVMRQADSSLFSPAAWSGCGHAVSGTSTVSSQHWQQSSGPVLITAQAVPDEALLQVSGKQQLVLEQQLDRITVQMKVQHFCQVLNIANIFNKKQLAIVSLLSYPYVADALSFSEALESCMAGVGSSGHE